MKLGSGIIVPIITPMKKDESINTEELRNQVNRLIKCGVHGIFTFGTNGEGYILSKQEKIEVLVTVISETKGRVPVYAGTGCISTSETIELSKIAEKEGADCLSIITPSFAKASQEELYEHYTAVAKEVSIPIILYNIPARTGNSLLPETVARLAKIPNIIGVKDSSGDYENMKFYIEKTKGESFFVLSGNDSLILDCLKAGGTGAVAGCANVYPENMVGIYKAFTDNDMEKAERYQMNIKSFRNCFQYGNPNTIVKSAVGMLGFDVGNCRRPFYKISEEGVSAIRKVLEDNKNSGIQ